MVKIGDVAQAAGVSAATVSRVLNNRSTVDPALAARVRAATAALGYRPNGVARNLRRRSTDLIALIISDVSNPFFTALTRGVEDVAQRNGLSVLLCNANEEPEKEAAYLRVAEQEQVAGVVISPHSTATDVSRLQAAGIPMTVIDRPLAAAVDTVMVDSVSGARTATAHLLEQGWRRPACMTGPLEAATAEQRLAGYRTALQAAGLDEELVARSSFQQAGGFEAAAALFDRAAPPDAVVVANALMALGLLEALTARGLAAGRDVGVVMFDDAPWAPFVAPPMTVVAQPAYDIGAKAATLLTDRIRGLAPESPTVFVFDTALIVRASSLRA
ncbi:MAG: LacI family transcriptional regulator [Propionibacteriaceae bacterium]|jgi:LacI family transcriptional regulator|nr:LacI family transcriptional regulator [Propionibacteriaceae bacterium]